MGGGLALLWRSSVDITLRSYSKNHIDVMVESVDAKPSWRLTGFYGEPCTSKRQSTWQLLRLLGKQVARPWCCIWDFNEILGSHEKEGGANKPASQMRAFQNAILDCRLFDLGWSGAKYTWENGHKDGTWTRQRWDKAMINVDWKLLFPEANCHTLFSTASEHMPVMVDWDKLRAAPCRDVGRARRRMFRFENGWFRDNECRQIIRRIWVEKSLLRGTNGSALRNTISKLNDTGRDVGKWGYIKYRKRKEDIRRKEQALEGFLQAEVNEGT